MKPKSEDIVRIARTSALYLYSEDDTMLAIRLSEDLEARLEALAAKTGRSKSYYAREAIEQHLEDLEDYYLALQRIEKALPTMSLAEVERRLGLAD